MAGDSLSSELAAYVCSLRYEDLSQSQVENMKLHFLDWLGSVYAGCGQRPIQIILELAQDFGTSPESTRFPDGSRTTCLSAALVNSASSCLMEMDDLHREAIFHPGSVVIPAALAVAERVRASGRDLIAALAAGYEVGIRIALGVGLSHYTHWHTTATCGTFAAAAGAAKVLGLDVERTVWALGSAGTQAAGLWEFLVESAMSKPLHIGKAAMNGLFSALLAGKGFTGPRRILEGAKGFFKATSNDYDEGKCRRGLGRESLFDRTSLKLYASCGHTHPAVDAVLLATGARPMAPGEIARVELYIYQAALDLLGNVQPTSPPQAKFHLPFCVATALRCGGVGFKDFSASQLMNAELQGLMGRVRVHSSSELTTLYPKTWAARVQIVTQDGRELKGFCEHPKGDPENPLDSEQVIQKFGSLTDTILPSETRDGIVDRVLKLERIPDVADLFPT